MGAAIFFSNDTNGMTKKMDLRNIFEDSFSDKNHKVLIISTLSIFDFSQMFLCQQTYKKNIKKPSTLDP